MHRKTIAQREEERISMKPPLKKSAPSKAFCSMCHVPRQNGDRLWRSKQGTPEQHGRERNSVGRQKAGISLSRLN